MEALSGRISTYVTNPLFSDAEEDEVFILNSPFRRPTRTFDNRYIDYEKPLTKSSQTSNSALSTHRLLLNIYEADNLFLPDHPDGNFLENFKKFYEHSNVLNGEQIRRELESKSYSFLDDEIIFSGEWNADSVIQFFEEFLVKERNDEALSATDSDVLTSIINSSDPQRCARHYLIQLASDFLSEASAMARLTPGAYGPVQSAIFNILIDEFGAGIHSQKHSTLFENTMKSAGLNCSVHHYWQFYHATSLNLTNYFHYITKNKQHFFKYIGALFYTETSLANTSKRQSDMLKSVFGDTVDTGYFDEHVHIDQHHGNMALNNVIRPILKQFGDVVAADVLRGFLEFRLLEEIADQDLISQFEFFSDLNKGMEFAENLYRFIEETDLEVPLETFKECRGERSTTHVHPDDRLLVIESGSMIFWPLAGEPLSLSAGDKHFIPKHRLHGSVVTSDECVYHQPIVSRDTIDRMHEHNNLRKIA